VHEAARRAGGRCRSWHDRLLDRVLDNGAHVALGANRALRRYLDLAGAGDRLAEIAPAAFPFLDLRDGRRWTVSPGGAWLLDGRRRPPGFGVADLVAGLRLSVAGSGTRVAEICRPDRPAHASFWEPLCAAALNTPPAEAAARSLGRVLRLAFAGGERQARAALPRTSLDDAFVAPALAALARAGADLRLGTRVGALEIAGGRVGALVAGGERIALDPGDGLVLAVPPWDGARLAPGLVPDLPASPIVNLHARLPRPGGPALLGLVAGTAQWLAVRGDVATAVVSAADALVDADSADSRLWAEVAAALGLPERPVPPLRLIKERRATLRQTPEVEVRRPPVATAVGNLALAGDWVRTGLPCTLEGAATSGFAAAARLRPAGAAKSLPERR
jgi:squalene-associated FAD-dependent desaturase